MADAIAIFVRALGAALEWLHMGLDALGAKPLIIAVLTMTLVIRYLLMPIMGGGSDKAREREEE